VSLPLSPRRSSAPAPPVIRSANSEPSMISASVTSCPSPSMVLPLLTVTPDLATK
jgi:hypothetical protein